MVNALLEGSRLNQNYISWLIHTASTRVKGLPSRNELLQIGQVSAALSDFFGTRSSSAEVQLSAFKPTAYLQKESLTIEIILPYSLYFLRWHLGIPHELLPHLLQQVASIIKLSLEDGKGIGKHTEWSCNTDRSGDGITVGDISCINLLKGGKEGREIWEALRMGLPWGVLDFWNVMFN